MCKTYCKKWSSSPLPTPRHLTISILILTPSTSSTIRRLLTVPARQLDNLFFFDNENLARLCINQSFFLEIFQ